MVLEVGTVCGPTKSVDAGWMGWCGWSAGLSPRSLGCWDVRVALLIREEKTIVGGGQSNIQY